MPWYETKNGDHYGRRVLIGEELEGCEEGEIILAMGPDFRTKIKFNVKDLLPLKLEPRKGNINKQESHERKATFMDRLFRRRIHKHNNCGGLVSTMDSIRHPHGNILSRCEKCGSQFVRRVYYGC